MTGSRKEAALAGIALLRSVFNERETAAVLAGLRALQATRVSLHGGPEIPPDEWAAIVDIGTDDGAFEPLSTDEIDVLCERINVTDLAPGKRPLYHEQHGAVIADDSTMIPITIQHVEMDVATARLLFAKGEPVGHWKHQIWRNVPAAEFPQIQAAARFYYGWKKGSETITENDDGTVTYEAFYAC